VFYALIIITVPLFSILNTFSLRKSSEALQKQWQCQEGTVSVLEKAYTMETGPLTACPYIAGQA